MKTHDDRRRDDREAARSRALTGVKRIEPETKRLPSADEQANKMGRAPWHKDDEDGDS
jgi:hypothetical protein